MKSIKVKSSKALPQGFKLSGIKAGIKYKNRLDLALIYSKAPCEVAGVWTQNNIQAACISYNKSVIKNQVNAIMINSGCANACTGERGEKNCKVCAEALAKILGIESSSVLLASTGVIGQQLPMQRILKVLPKLVKNRADSKKSVKQASRAILTTDTYPKVCGIELCGLRALEQNLNGQSMEIKAQKDSKNINKPLESAQGTESSLDTTNSDSTTLSDSLKVEGGKGVRLQSDKNKNADSKKSKNLKAKKDSKNNITKSKNVDSTDSKKSKKSSPKSLSPVHNKIRIWGMAKGSGMIHPNMATMLGFILTDVSITKALLQEALSEVVEKSFNQISVDGDTSTNDMVVMLSNGKAGNEQITQKDSDYDAFKKALKKVCVSLAKKIAMDGEGAGHLLEVEVKNANTKQEARTLSKSIVSSNLVKTAIFGRDANWGRIICAMGYSGVEFDSTHLSLYFRSKNGSIDIMRDGEGVKFSEAKAREILSAKKIKVVVDLGGAIESVAMKSKNGVSSKISSEDSDKKAGVSGKNFKGESAKAWGCDLSYDYIKINADYRS